MRIPGIYKVKNLFGGKWLGRVRDYITASELYASRHLRGFSRLPPEPKTFPEPINLWCVAIPVWLRLWLVLAPLLVLAGLVLATWQISSKLSEESEHTRLVVKHQEVVDAQRRR